MVLRARAKELLLHATVTSAGSQARAGGGLEPQAVTATAAEVRGAQLTRPRLGRAPSRYPVSHRAAALDGFEVVLCRTHAGRARLACMKELARRTRERLLAL
jgi:hypothetical protein